MKTSRMVICALVAALLCGCASVHSSTARDKGARLRDSEFTLWPLFSAERTVYANGVQQDGNILCFIQWSTWYQYRTPKPAPSALKEEPAACSSSAQAAS